MNDSLKMGKRALTTAVATATMLWSAGVSSFVAPLTARAAMPGDLIKGTTLSTVYYYGSNGSRYTFPNEKTYLTWYSNFSGVRTVSDSELAAMPIGGNIVYRPGSRWVKIMSDNKTYAVTPQGQLRWIETEAVAQGLAGSAWGTMIDDVPDVYFADYNVGASITSASNGYNGMLVANGGNTYLIWNGMKRMVSASGMSANRLQSRFVMSGSGVNVAGMTAGADLTMAEGVLTDTAQMGGTVSGGLSVSLASDTPAGATIPSAASSVQFAKFKLMANSGSASINQLVFRLGGVGATSNITDVYLYDGDNRLTDGRSVNSSTRNVTFSGLNLSMASGESKYLTLRADVSSSASGGDTANFTLVSASDVAGTATVSGNFPIMGNTMTFSTTQAGSVTISKTGSIANPTLGQKEATIGRFSVDASGEDAWLKQITLTVDDVTDHSNYKLWNGTTLMGTGTVRGDLVSFTFANPLKIEEGGSESLRLTADIGGKANDKVNVAIEEKADSYAIGGDFGFNLGAVIDGYDDTASTCTDCSTSEIQGGTLTFAFNGPVSDDIQIDGKDQVLMKFTVTAEQMAEINEMQVRLDCMGANCDEDGDNGGLVNGGVSKANLQDVSIRRANGTTWMGPEEITVANGNDDQFDLTFTDDQTMQAGQSLDLMVTADVYSGAIDADEFRATLLMSTVKAKDMNNKTLTDIVPTSNLVGNTMTLSASALTVTQSAPPSDGTFVKGASGVSVVGYSFEAGNTSDVTVTDVTFTATGDDDGELTADNNNDITVRDHVNSCSLYDSTSGALIDGPESVTTANKVLFENFHWTVKAGETQKAVLKCNFANVDTEDTLASDDAYAFRIVHATDDITAEDKDGDSVTEDLSVATVAASPEIVVVTSGTLDITVDGSTPKSTIVLGNSTGLTVSKYKLVASDEPFIVQKVTLRNCVTTGSDVNDDCADVGEVAGQDDVAAVVKVTYADQSGVTKTKQGFLTGGMVTFSDMDMYVPTDSSKTLTVMVDTNAVSSTAATSGDQIQLNFDAQDAGSSIFKATGLSSNSTLTEASGIIDATYEHGNPMTIRKTKPTINLASGNLDRTEIPGPVDALKFTVAADSRGAVKLNAVTFKVSSTDNRGTPNGWNLCGDADGVLDDATTWDLFDSTSPSTALDDNEDWFFLDSVTADDACTATQKINYVVLDLANGTQDVEEIAAGTTKTYIVRADTTGASSADDDTFRLDIVDQAIADGLNEDCVNGAGEECYSYDSNDANGGVDHSSDDVEAISWNDDEEATEVNGEFINNLKVLGPSISF